MVKGWAGFVGGSMFKFQWGQKMKKGKKENYLSKKKIGLGY